MITIFSAPKPFVDEQIAVIQRNAIRSWLRLDPQIQVILLGQEPGIEQAARALGAEWLPVHSRTSGGTPLLDEIFHAAGDAARNAIMCYINADIILLDDILPVVENVDARFEQYLIVGTRWDIDLGEELAYDTESILDLKRRLGMSGRLHPPMGSDYFLYPKGQMRSIPPFALGRAGWDNWMIFQARRKRIAVIDASSAITAIHQNHDYRHLPGGQPHYRHPESDMNVSLAGGQEAMFRLRDANWLAGPDGLRRKRFLEWEWPHKMEADWIARLGPGKAARAVRMGFHPQFAVAYLLAKLSLRSEAGGRSGSPPQGKDQA